MEKGEVPPNEQRDREFSERKITQLEVPFAGMTIIRVARYGSLSYFILRDLERKLYHLAYDPRLEPLIENVIDVYRLADSFEANLSRGPDGRPLAVADHYAANFKDEEVARSEYRRARTALRAPRTDLAPMTVDRARRTAADRAARDVRANPRPGRDGGPSADELSARARRRRQTRRHAARRLAAGLTRRRRRRNRWFR